MSLVDDDAPPGPNTSGRSHGPGPSRRRVWCETVSSATLTAPSTAQLLCRHGIDPILAVWPDTIDRAHDAALRLAGAGLRPAIWPMLADADGRWISADNAAVFCAFAERLAHDLEAPEIVLDLEPPIAAVREPWGMRAVNAHMLRFAAGARSFRAARERIAALAGRLRDHGARVSAAIVPAVLLDPRGGPAVWQELLGTPVDGIAWDHVSPMLYTSLLEGWSRGLLSRAEARALLGWSCRATARRFGPIAGASLGAVGTGAFGDEPTYRAPAELADDVAVARAAGLDDLALFDLGGVLRRPPVEPWLEAFTATEPAATLPDPVLLFRARAALAALRVMGGACALLLSARARAASAW